MMDSDCVGIRYPWETPPKAPEAIEIAPGVLWMRLPLPMKLDHVNVYAFDEGDSWTLIDTGMFSKTTLRVWQGLLSGALRDKPVGRVLVTHHHPDHVGMAGWFQTENGAELLMPRTPWLFARMLMLDNQSVASAEQITFWQRAGMRADVLEQRKNERPFNFADVVYPMPLGFTRIKEGDVLRIGGRDWDIRMGNGHAPEHATLWSRDDNLVIGGDQLLPSISSNIGVYATEPMADPVSDWIEACERLSAFARPDQLVLCGHKLPFTGLPTRLRQLTENHHGALNRLRDALQTPRTAGDCFDALFKRTIGDAEYGLALVEAVSHVNHLYLAGELTRQTRADGAWVYSSR